MQFLYADGSVCTIRWAKGCFAARAVLCCRRSNSPNRFHGFASAQATSRVALKRPSGISAVISNSPRMAPIIFRRVLRYMPERRSIFEMRVCTANRVDRRLEASHVRYNSRSMQTLKTDAAQFQRASDQSLLIYFGHQITLEAHDRIRKLPSGCLRRRSAPCPSG